MSKKYAGVYKNEKTGKYFYLTKIKVEDRFKSVRSQAIYDTAFECSKAMQEARITKITTSNVKKEIEHSDPHHDPHIETEKITTSNVKTSLKTTCMLLLSQYELGRESTYESVKKSVNNYFINWFPPETTINELCNIQAINDYITKLKSKGFKTDYANRILSTYKKLCEVAFYNGDISQYELGIVKNNMRMLKDDGSVSHTDSDKKRFFTIQEYNQFRNCIHDYKYQVLFDFMFWSGCRIGETLGITSKDVKNYNGLINIDKQRLPNGDITNVLKTKNSYRKIPIKTGIYLELIDYINKLQLTDDDLLFNTSRTSIQRVLNDTIKESGLEYISKHSFRHSTCSNLCNIFIEHNQPINFLYVANYLGDTIQTVQETYAHLTGTTLDNIQNLIDE